MKSTISVKDASRELGMTEQAVRIRIDRGLFNPPIGYAFPSIQGNRTSYYIYRDLLDAYLGKEKKID